MFLIFIADYLLNCYLTEKLQDKQQQINSPCKEIVVH